MGIDYDANFGIGYEVTNSGELSEEDIEDGMFEYIDENVDERFWCFEAGEGNYTGEDNSSFIVVRDAFKDGLDLTGKKKMLDEELKRLNLSPVGDFGDVGGLHVW